MDLNEFRNSIAWQWRTGNKGIELSKLENANGNSGETFGSRNEESKIEERNAFFSILDFRSSMDLLLTSDQLAALFVGW